MELLIRFWWIEREASENSGEGKANTNVLGRSSASNSSLCSGWSCMLVGVQEPATAYSEMVTDMIA